MIFIAGLLIAFVCIKFGMLLIMVKLLEIALQAALLVIAGLGIAFIWRKVFGPKLSQQKTWRPEKFISKGE